jgi:hypothetical protein
MRIDSKLLKKSLQIALSICLLYAFFSCVSYFIEHSNDETGIQKLLNNPPTKSEINKMIHDHVNFNWSDYRQKGKIYLCQERLNWDGDKWKEKLCDKTELTELYKYESYIQEGSIFDFIVKIIIYDLLFINFLINIKSISIFIISIIILYLIQILRLRTKDYTEKKSHLKK